MTQTGKSLKGSHFPVMLSEVMSLCHKFEGGKFLDCTFGAGGYSKKLLEIPNSKIVALDRDVSANYFAEKIKKKFPNRFFYYNERFSNLGKINLDEKFDVIIFDLGLSSVQINDTNRGFSFNSDGPLDMRMGLSKSTAENVLNTFPEKDLKFILKFFGEEKDSNKIAKNIVKKRGIKKIKSVRELVELIYNSKKKIFNEKINPCTKSFQAIRIFVNKEITELIEGIIQATKLLKKGGKIIIISFHSIEDKIVKFFFKSNSSNVSNLSRYMPEQSNNKNFYLFEKYKNKILRPKLSEIKKNKASRSAKMRFATRSKYDFHEIESLKNKFKKYLDLEKKNV